MLLPELLRQRLAKRVDNPDDIEKRISRGAYERSRKADYDLVIGGIANDKIFKTIDLYFTGDITKDEALKRLKYEKPNNQYCCRTLSALNLLSFHSSEDITR